MSAARAWWALSLGLGAAALSPAAAQEARDPKVLVITMFRNEAAPWVEALDLADAVPVQGLSPEFPEVLCDDELCLMTTGMGFANAAASVSAVALSDAFDLSDTYVLVAGIAGVDPEHGTLGSAHWARFVVDGDLRHRIDPREVPEGWTTGAVPLGAEKPGAEAGWRAGTEVYELDPALIDAALALTRGVALADGEAAAAYRSAYAEEAARRAPFVSACDTVSGDTYWHGELMARDAEAAVEGLTGGRGTYCTTQMEDNATLTALARAAEAGRLDLSRVAVLRTGSNFDRPAPGQTAAASLAADSGGFGPATTNAFRVGHAFAEAIVEGWDEWAEGVPAAAR